MSRYAPRHADDVAALIACEMLGLVVTHDQDGYVATPLPLLAETDDSGRVIALLGHFARANPHVERVMRQPQALVTFLGAHGVVPTAAVSNPDWAPTWNYALAQFEVTVTFEPDNTDAVVRALVTAVEGADEQAWTPERMGERYNRLLHHVIAFRAVVTSEAARFKLGQDEDPATFAQILRHLGNSPLADAMRGQERGRDDAVSEPRDRDLAQQGQPT